MPLSREEVLHVASLCRLLLTDEEIPRLQDQLGNILEQFETLSSVDTESTRIGTDSSLSSVMRPDTPGDSFPREEMLANSPQREGDFIRIPPVLEES